jgi:hypothetical protein
LFYASGLRLRELVNLVLEDVHLGARMVRVLGKGRKERVVPFNHAAADALKKAMGDRALFRQAYIPRVHPEIRKAATEGGRKPASASVRKFQSSRVERDENALFLNYRGGRLTPRSVQRLVARYGQDLHFVPARNQWLVWNGWYCNWDLTRQVERFAKETIRSIYGDAAQIEDEDQKTRLVAHAYASEKDLLRLAAIVASTALVLWVAHLYSQAISERISRGRRLTFPEIRSIARRELGILLAAVLPVAVLLVGTLGLVEDSTAVWIAMGVGLATLAAEALRYARLERLGPGPTAVALVLNLALGSLVVLLKIGIEH